MSSAVAYLCRRMKGSIALVIIGVDPHKRTHTASVVETGTDKVLSDIENPLLVVPGFTVLLRQDRQKRSRTSSRIHSASRRTQRQLNLDQFSAVAADMI